MKTSTPNSYVYGELGVYPLFIERQVRVIKYWLKLIKLNNDKGIFVYSIYKQLSQLSISQPRAVTWATRVRDTLYRCNLGTYWDSRTVSNDTFFISLLRRRLQDNYLTEWTNGIIDSTDGRLYKFVKESFCYEPYLDIISSAQLRNAITRIRLSSHRYKIETGR